MGFGSAILRAAYMVLTGLCLAFFGLMSLGATGSSLWLVSTAVGVLVSWALLAWRIWLGLRWHRARAAKLGSAGMGSNERPLTPDESNGCGDLFGRRRYRGHACIVGATARDQNPPNRRLEENPICGREQRQLTDGLTARRSLAALHLPPAIADEAESIVNIVPVHP